MLSQLNPFASAPNDPRQIADGNLKRVNSYGLRFGLIPIVAVVALAWTASFDKSLQIVAFATAITAAAFAAGGILGFLFGIPRSLSEPGDAASKETTADAAAPPAAATTANPKPAERSSTINSNLVQVSDWLTKVLLGAALTQIEGIYNGFVKLVEKLSPFLGAAGACLGADCPPTVFGQGVVGGLVLYGLIYGFMWGHLWTTLFLNIAYRDLENSLRAPFNPKSVSTVAQATESLREITTPATSPSGAIRTDLNFTDDDRKAARTIVSTPLQQLSNPKDLADWARAKLVLNDLDSAVVAYRQAIGLQPNNANLMIELAEALGANNRYKDAAEQYRQVAALPATAIDDTRRNEARFNAVLNFLYVPPPDGFKAALDMIRSMEGSDAFETNPHFWVLVASAHGQAYRYKQNDATAAGDLPDHREKALAAVRKVRALAANQSNAWVEYLRTLWRPADYHNNGVDNDLEAFRDDPDFAQELQE